MNEKITSKTDDPIPSFVDESGPIRYDWPSIKLLYASGAGVSEIAHSMSKDFPEQFKRIRAAIAQRCSLDEWPKIREAGQALAHSRPAGSKNNDSLSVLPPSHNVTAIAQNLQSARKSRYLEVTSKFIEKASNHLEGHPIQCLADAAMAAKLFAPVHEIAKDVHGLNGKDGQNLLQVNVLSQWAGGIPVIDSDNTSDHNQPDSM